MDGKDPSTRCDDYVVVALHGEIDLANAAHVGGKLAAVADSQPKIVVDLTGQLHPNPAQRQNALVIAPGG